MSFSISLKVTVPKRLFKDKGWVDEISSNLKNRTAPTLKKLFGQTTYGWSNHPSFRQTLTRRASSLSMAVYTEDSIYGLVNAGSPKHRIPKTGTILMSYKPGYRSATRPGTLMSRRAYRSGKQRAAMVINHPGFKPRKFDELVAKEYDPIFRKDVQDAINRVARS